MTRIHGVVLDAGWRHLPRAPTPTTHTYRAACAFTYIPLMRLLYCSLLDVPAAARCCGFTTRCRRLFRRC